MYLLDFENYVIKDTALWERENYLYTFSFLKSV